MIYVRNPPYSKEEVDGVIKVLRELTEEEKRRPMKKKKVTDCAGHWRVQVDSEEAKKAQSLPIYG